MTNKRIAVIGDIALDFSYFVEPSLEKSVESGLEVQDVKKYNYDCGGAANLAADIANLDVQCDLFGVVGNDIFAKILIEKLGEFSVGTRFIVEQEKFTTFVYHKHYDTFGHELPRFDLGKANSYTEETKKKLLSNIEDNINSYDAIVINQQIPNTIHSDSFVDKLSALLDKFNGEVWVDSRIDLMYPNASYKFNRVEAKERTGEDSVEKAATIFMKRKPGPRDVVITMGKDGAYGTDGKQSIKVLGFHDVKKTDPVGAGDAFLAGLVASRIMGRNLKESMEYGNANASVSAGTLFATGHPTPIQTKELLDDPDYRYNPRLARDPRLAKYIDSTEIEIVNEVGSSNYPKVAIFDHDGTISTMRHGWEKIMREMMVRAIAGRMYKDLTANELDTMYNAVDAMIEKTTGIQTIVQMSQLLELINDYGYIPKAEIKTPLEYKDEYRKLLNEQLKCKYNRFKDGIYNVQDLTMKGAISFLEELKRNGTKVFLASGSDFSDVKYETDTLGYSKLFTGGIHGSVSDLSKDPKKKVMGEIISSIDVDSSQVVVFGDGPVEMREAKKRGFLTIGIISDEHQRFGMNPAKRERLILAGADILIPDFSWMCKLEEYLGWRKA